MLLPAPTVQSVNSTIPSHCHTERWVPNLYFTLDQSLLELNSTIPSHCHTQRWVPNLYFTLDQSVLELEELDFCSVATARTLESPPVFCTSLCRACFEFPSHLIKVSEIYYTCYK